MKKILLLIAVTASLFAFEPVHHNDSFVKSKKILYTKIFKDHQETFYCKNPYSYKFNQVQHRKMNMIFPDDRYYTPRLPLTKKGKINIRTQRIEAEHIMPAFNFGRQMTCWRDGDPTCVKKKKGKLTPYAGRQCCEKVSKEFRLMEADLHNLVPAIGEVNGDRSNFRYADSAIPLKGEYGQCQIDIDFKDRKAYPADYTKGMISRAYLYMSQTYGIKLSKQDRRLMEAWNKKYPVSDWERERNRRIKAIQGNGNPYVK